MPDSEAQSDTFPLPHSPVALPQALIRLNLRCRGELKKIARGGKPLLAAERAQRVIDATEVLLKELGVAFHPEELKPISTEPKIGPLDTGEMVSAIFEALRHAEDFVTSNEVVDWICEDRGVELYAGQRKHFLQKIRECLHVQKDEGWVIAEKLIAKGDTSQVQRWKLNPARF